MDNNVIEWSMIIHILIYMYAYRCAQKGPMGQITLSKIMRNYKSSKEIRKQKSCKSNLIYIMQNNIHKE